MRTLLFAAAIALGAVACGSDLDTHVNALTGEACEPNDSYQPRPKKTGNGPKNPKCQGTGNGDNCDDLSSGKIDCIGDGNSGQGDDGKHDCEFPQPGCDETGCCDDDLVVDPPDEPVEPGDPTQPTEPTDPTDPAPPDPPTTGDLDPHGDLQPRDPTIPPPVL